MGIAALTCTAWPYMGYRNFRTIVKPKAVGGAASWGWRTTQPQAVSVTFSLRCTMRTLRGAGKRSPTTCPKFQRMPEEFLKILSGTSEQFWSIPPVLIGAARFLLLTYFNLPVCKFSDSRLEFYFLRYEKMWIIFMLAFYTEVSYFTRKAIQPCQNSE